MSRKARRQFDVETVRAVLDALAEREPERIDRRSQTHMRCRYTEHGETACLVGEILHTLGVSIGFLKALDRAADGDPVLLAGSGLDRRFTDNAFALLRYLQRENDRGRPWGEIRKDALSIVDSWAGGLPGQPYSRYTYRGRPWLNDTRALNADEYDKGSQ